jgi:hypothetical protein
MTELLYRIGRLQARLDDQGAIESFERCIALAASAGAQALQASVSPVSTCSHFTCVLLASLSPSLPSQTPPYD